MLKGIDPVLSPELLMHLSAMGHGEWVAVVDANFTEAQGLDFVMEVNATAHLPILIVTPPDDPHCAIEARRIGVFNYLVKTEKIYSVLEVALNEATEKFNDQEELKRTVLAQRQRIVELEKQLSRTGQQKALAAQVPPPLNDAQWQADLGLGTAQLGGPLRIAQLAASE